MFWGSASSIDRFGKVLVLREGVSQLGGVGGCLLHPQQGSWGAGAGLRVCSGCWLAAIAGFCCFFLVKVTTDNPLGWEIRADQV